MTYTPQDQSFSAFKDGLRDRCGAFAYRNYFEGLTLAAWDQDKVMLVAPSGFAAERISAHYATDLCDVWDEQCGPVENIQLARASGGRVSWLRPRDAGGAAGPKGPQSVLRPPEQRRAPSVALRAGMAKPLTADAPVPLPRSPSRSNQGATGRSASHAPVRPQPQAQAPTPATPSATIGGVLNDAQTLENFCVSDANRMARLAVQQFLDGQATPITYIHGANGYGKSHLINAAAKEYLARHPRRRLIYLTYESLIADVSGAFVSDSIKELRGFLSDTDVLVFDDVQLLRGRKRTQEELACLLERLQQMGRSILVAGALSPKALIETGISSRLVDRLGGGMCVSISAPDEGLRLAVAEQMAEAFFRRTGIVIARRHLDYVARRCEGSIRDLEGTMQFFALAIEARGEATDLSDEWVRSVLEEKLAVSRAAVTLEDIFGFTCHVFGVSPSEMRGRARHRPIVRARQAFCLAARKLTDSPLTAIGAMTSRDHTTVMHSVRQAEVFASGDVDFGHRINRIFDQYQR